MPTSKEDLKALLSSMTPEERAELLNPTYADTTAEEGYGQIPLEDRQKTGPTPTRKQAETPDHTEDKYAATKWGGDLYRDLECPSGQTCLVRRPGLQGLVKAGILHDIDPIMPLITAHEDRMAGKEEQLDFGRQVMSDPEKMASVLHMVDRVVVHTVVKPQITMTPNDVTLRQEGVIYADMVDLEDKMFIMNFAVGGAADVAKFRRELSENVGDVDDEPEPGDSSE